MPSAPALWIVLAPVTKKPQEPAPLEQAEPTFWMSSQSICVVLRAVTILSYDSLASCLAIMSCCEVCVAARAMPNTPSRLTSPTVSMAIEITTSISEKPRCICFGIRSFPRLFIDVAIDNLPIHCCRAAIHGCVPWRPTASQLASSASLPREPCKLRLHPRCPNNFRCYHPALNRPGRSKPCVILRWRARYSPCQSLELPYHSRRGPLWGARFEQEMLYRWAIDRSRYSALPEMLSALALP